MGDPYVQQLHLLVLCIPTLAGELTFEALVDQRFDIEISILHLHMNLLIILLTNCFFTGITGALTVL